MGGKPFEIVYEDDQFKPDVGKQKSEKLVQQDKVNFVAGYIWSNVLLASLKAVTDEGDTILISANAGPSQIAGELCNKNFFSTSWQNDQTPMAMGEYLNTKGVKSLYLMGPNYRRRQGHAGRRAAYLQGPDHRRGLHQMARPARLLGRAGQDRRGQARGHLHLLSRRAWRSVRQAVGRSPASTRPCRSTRCSRSTRSPCRSRATWRSEPWGAQEWVNDQPNEQNKRYVADFKKKHGVYPSYYGAQSYDAIMLIASAAEALKGDLSNKDKVRAELKKGQLQVAARRLQVQHQQLPDREFLHPGNGEGSPGHDDGQDHRHGGEGCQGFLLREVSDEVTAARFARRCHPECSEGSLR